MINHQTTEAESQQVHRPFVVAVIPAFNESKRIGAVVSLVTKHAHLVIVVNDASSDNTTAIAKSQGAQVVELDKNMGAGYATRIGCLNAIEKGADVIITIDADGQHDANEIPLLLEPLLQQGKQIVFGGRPRNPTMPFENRFGNGLISVVIGHLFDIGVKDTLTGFRAFRADVFDKIVWHSNRYSFVSEMVVNMAIHKLHYAEVPITTIYHDNKKGMRKRDGIKTLFLLFGWKIKSLLGYKTA